MWQIETMADPYDEMTRKCPRLSLEFDLRLKCERKQQGRLRCVDKQGV